MPVIYEVYGGSTDKAVELVNYASRLYESKQVTTYLDFVAKSTFKAKYMHAISTAIQRGNSVCIRDADNDAVRYDRGFRTDLLVLSTILMTLNNHLDMNLNMILATLTKPKIVLMIVTPLILETLPITNNNISIKISTKIRIRIKTNNLALSI